MRACHVSRTFVAVLYWLGGFVVLCALSLFSKDKLKSWSINALLIYATIFVGVTLNASLTSGKRGKGIPVMQVQQAEILLRLRNAASSIVSSSASRNVKEIEKLTEEAAKALRKIVDQSPNDPLLLAKLIIVENELGQKPVDPYLKQLSTIDSANARELTRAFAIYDKKSIKPDEAKEIEDILVRDLPGGYYRTTALLDLYSTTRQVDKLQALRTQVKEKSMLLLAKLIALGTSIALLFLVGVIFIFAQLFFLPRKLSTPEAVEAIASPVKFSPKLIYGVFIAWLATELMVGSIAGAFLKDFHLIKQGIVVAALSTAGLYLLSNGPGVLYVYFLALKPNGIGFLEGIKMRFKSGKLGLIRLVSLGVLTWCSALPIILAVAWISQKYLGSEGSDNPVLGLVMEAARSSNISATLVFYFTLGVLAPICEESLFRGFLYTSLRRYWPIIPSMALSALLFSSAHLDKGGFLSLFTLGMLFAFVMERTKSILPAMVAHGMWNSATFTMVILLFSD